MVTWKQRHRSWMWSGAALAPWCLSAKTFCGPRPLSALMVKRRRARKLWPRAYANSGLKLDVWDPDIEQLRADPGFQDVADSYQGRPVVVGVLPGTGGGRSLILNGHIDVVATGPHDEWPHGGPWGGAVVDGHLYGRGASDMKSGLASYIEAIASLNEAGVRLKGDVIVQSVIDEEQGGNGTLAAVLRGYRADGALIGEPTNMTLVTKNAGIRWVRITVSGKSAHGAYRHAGVNAIEKAMLLYQALMTYEAERVKDYSDPLFAHYQTPFPFSFGVFKAGNWPSVVPDEAVMEGRVGFLPTSRVNSSSASSRRAWERSRPRIRG